MSEIKHTPGPLHAVRGDSAVMVLDDAGNRIGITSRKPSWQRHDETDFANATLWAAAPDMYEALLQCREYLKHSLGSTSDVNPYPAIDAALARVEGRGEAS